MSLLEESETARQTAGGGQGVDLSSPEWYLNRELSWLDFNDRVQAEAADERVPLLERVRFLAIAASNLDEFYAKRMGWLQRQLRTQPEAVTADGRTIAEQAAAVRARCTEARIAMESLWQEAFLPRLAEHGIEVVPVASLDAATREQLREYFTTSVFPMLTPLVVDPAHPFPFISSETLSLALTVQVPATGGDTRFARVKVPENRPRFVPVDGHRFVMLEDLIAVHADLLFPGMEVQRWSPIRVLRSAEMTGQGEDADDLLELVEAEIRRRRLAEAVALEVTEDIPHLQLDMLLRELDLGRDDVVCRRGPLRLADLVQLADLSVAGLVFENFTPAVPGPFQALQGTDAVFDAIREGDILVHHPYESFDMTVSRFIDEASEDPSVLAIKHTTYRTSPDSPILESLIDAAGRGKQVAVLVELTARFDEANNIEWARKLESSGVHVAYGSWAMKTHCKISLVVREEADAVRMYAHIGTGNYNSRTARVYTDFGLLTADPAICNDLVRIFNHLTASARLHSEELLVAPANLRQEFERRVRREIEHARAGRPAWLKFKMNALEDPEFTRLLYEASMAGVKVDLVIRGICRLRPGIRGVSENVRVVSVVGRFLEHSRAYVFGNDGSPEYFIGSADLMKRNLDERIEVLAPVYAPALRRHIDEVFDLLLHDRRQGWRLVDSDWRRDENVDEPGTQATLLARAPFS